MRELSISEIGSVNGGDLTWGSVGAAFGAWAGSAFGGFGAVVGGLGGQAAGEYFGCESTVNACNTEMPYIIMP